MRNWEWAEKTVDELDSPEWKLPTADDWAQYFAWLREQEAVAI